mmetsp:Transcript_36276/g.82403  ORF Transcript_36276/g.82403 Transcript_36276/m.82403 type:complete len:784 (+) Transcript_36276:68-2419(+)
MAEPAADTMDFEAFYNMWMANNVTQVAKRRVEFRPGTAQYRSFVRDVQFYEQQQRSNLNSLPELERSRSQSVPLKNYSTSGTKLPPVVGGGRGVSKSGRTASQPMEEGSNEECAARLAEYLHPRTCRLHAQELVRGNGRFGSMLQEREQRKLALSSSVMSQPSWTTEDEPEEEASKTFLTSNEDDGTAKATPKKVVKPPPAWADPVADVLEWQPGLMKSVEGRFVLKEPNEHEFHKDTFDTILVLQKTKQMIKMMRLRDKIKVKQTNVCQGTPTFGKLEMPTYENYQGGTDESGEPYHINFVKDNLAKVQTGSKEGRRVVRLESAAIRIHQQLQTRSKAIAGEDAWRREVAERLELRQDRRRNRIFQSRWFPLLVLGARLRVWGKTLVYQRKRGGEVRAATTIQRGFRRAQERKFSMKLSLGAARVLRYRVRRWLKALRARLMDRKADLCLKFLKDVIKCRAFTVTCAKYKQSIVRCQKYIRNFLVGQRVRMKNLHKLWDRVLKDLAGDASGSRQWILRLLSEADSKNKLCRQELQRMRLEFVQELRAFSSYSVAYQLKMEAYKMVCTMGMDETFVKQKMGVEQTPHKPHYPLQCPRKVMRHYVERALKDAGCLEFCITETLKEGQSKAWSILQDLHHRSLRAEHKHELREIFDMVDVDGSGQLEEEEVHHFLRELTLNASIQDSRVVFLLLRPRNQQSVTYDEFISRLANWKKLLRDSQKENGEELLSPQGSPRSHEGEGEGGGSRIERHTTEGGGGGSMRTVRRKSTIPSDSHANSSRGVF